MSILKGSLSARRFRVVGDVPADFREKYAEALSAYGFKTPADAKWTDAKGWVEIERPLDTAFDDLNRWLLDRYVVFALRVDKRKVSASMARALLKQHEEAWCAEQSKPRCPAAVRKELRERIEFELLSTTAPKMRTFEVVWNIIDRYVLFTCYSDTVIDVFRKLFFQTFGLKLVDVSPLDLLADEGPEALTLAAYLLATSGARFHGDTEAATVPMGVPENATVNLQADDATPLLPHFAPEFLLYLWHAVAEDMSIEIVDPTGAAYTVDAWVDTSIVMRATSSSTSATSMRGENPSASEEALATARGGKVPFEMRLGLRLVGDDEKEFLFALRGPRLDVVGLKLPQVVKGGGEEAFYDRMALYEELLRTLAGLFALYARDRTTPAWPSVHEAIVQWIAGDEADDDDGDNFDGV